MGGAFGCGPGAHAPGFTLPPSGLAREESKTASGRRISKVERYPWLKNTIAASVARGIVGHPRRASGGRLQLPAFFRAPAPVKTTVTIKFLSTYLNKTTSSSHENTRLRQRRAASRAAFPPNRCRRFRRYRVSRSGSSWSREVAPISGQAFQLFHQWLKGMEPDHQQMQLEPVTVGGLDSVPGMAPETSSGSFPPGLVARGPPGFSGRP
jgi:hypothetical protein